MHTLTHKHSNEDFLAALHAHNLDTQSVIDAFGSLSEGATPDRINGLKDRALKLLRIEDKAPTAAVSKISTAEDATKGLDLEALKNSPAQLLKILEHFQSEYARKHELYNKDLPLYEEKLMQIHLLDMELGLAVDVPGKPPILSEHEQALRGKMRQMGDRSHRYITAEPELNTYIKKLNHALATHDSAELNEATAGAIKFISEALQSAAKEGEPLWERELVEQATKGHSIA